MMGLFIKFGGLDFGGLGLEYSNCIERFYSLGKIIGGSVENIEEPI